MMTNKNDFYSFIVYRKREIKKTVLLSLILSLATQGHSSAYGIDYRDALKLYAHSKIVNDKQYQCFYKLITKESNWRVAAQNGSHYGLGQMRNIKAKNLDGFTQVDWSLRYINKRYGSMCNAWRFFVKKGYH